MIKSRNNMESINKIQKAIKFATKTHEIYQKQKRKGKDVSYISHPLAVGLLLSCVKAGDDVVCAGILHDTIEDSISEKKVTFEMLEERFGKDVAQMVLDVTETDKTLSWEERKKKAIEHIKECSHNSLLVKSADVISNLSELINDYDKDGDQVFLRFNAPKYRIIKNYLETITAIIENWKESPFAQELHYLAGKLQMIGAAEFMVKTPAGIIEYADYDENKELECPVCGWHGLGVVNTDSHFCLDVSCPNCDKMLLIVNYPLAN